MDILIGHSRYDILPWIIVRPEEDFVSLSLLRSHILSVPPGSLLKLQKWKTHRFRFLTESGQFVTVWCIETK